MDFQRPSRILSLLLQFLRDKGLTCASHRLTRLTRKIAQGSRSFTKHFLVNESVFDAVFESPLTMTVIMFPGHLPSLLSLHSVQKI